MFGFSIVYNNWIDFRVFPFSAAVDVQKVKWHEVHKIVPHQSRISCYIKFTSILSITIQTNEFL